MIKQVRITRIQKIISMKKVEKRNFITDFLNEEGLPEKANRIDYSDKAKVNAIIYFMKYENQSINYWNVRV